MAVGKVSCDVGPVMCVTVIRFAPGRPGGCSDPELCGDFIGIRRVGGHVAARCGRRQQFLQRSGNRLRKTPLLGGLYGLAGGGGFARIAGDGSGQVLCQRREVDLATQISVKVGLESAQP